MKHCLKAYETASNAIMARRCTRSSPAGAAGLLPPSREDCYPKSILTLITFHNLFANTSHKLLPIAASFITADTDFIGCLVRGRNINSYLHWSDRYKE